MDFQSGFPNNDNSWRTFGNSQQQPQQQQRQQDSSFNGGGLLEDDVMNPPIRRQPSTLSNSSNMLQSRGMSSSHRMRSSHQLSNSNFMSNSSSRSRFQQQQNGYDNTDGDNSSSGISNAVFNLNNNNNMMSNNNLQQQRQSSSQNFNNMNPNGAFGNRSMSQSGMPSSSLQVVNVHFSASGQNAMFSSTANNRQQQQQSGNGGGGMNRFLSSGNLGRGQNSSFNESSQRNSSSQFLSSSIKTGSSPLASALSRKIQSTSVLGQQQYQQQQQSRPTTNSNFSNLLSSNKQKSSNSLFAAAMNDRNNNSNSSMRGLSSTMGPPAFSNANRTSSIVNARLSSGMENNNGTSSGMRNSMSMSAIGRSSLGSRSISSASIGNKLFPGGALVSASSRNKFAMSQASSAANGMNTSLSSSRNAKSSTSLGSFMRSKSSQSFGGMSSVQSNIAMLLNRNKNQPFNNRAQSLQQQQQQQQRDSQQSRKRTLEESDLITSAIAAKVSRSLTGATARRNNATMNSDSLLHNSCKLYPKTLVVLESALAFDPEAIRRSVPLLVGNPEDGSKKDMEDGSEGGKEDGAESLKRAQQLQFPSAATTAKVGEKGVSSFKTSSWYSYPFNIAMKHDAGLDVLNFLAKEGPDVLAKVDGDEEASSLGIVLGMERPSLDIVRLILSNNTATLQVADRQSNLPLHVAVRAPLESSSDRLELVRLLYGAYPAALSERNFHGETPLDIAVRSPFSSDSVVDYLQQRSLPAEDQDVIEPPTPF